MTNVVPFCNLIINNHIMFKRLVNRVRVIMVQLSASEKELKRGRPSFPFQRLFQCISFSVKKLADRPWTKNTCGFASGWSKS